MKYALLPCFLSCTSRQLKRIPFFPLGIPNAQRSAAMSPPTPPLSLAVPPQPNNSQLSLMAAFDVECLRANAFEIGVSPSLLLPQDN
jgi:hypothetical protein